MKAARELAWLDARIAEVQARSRRYRGEDRASRHRADKDPPQLPPSPPPLPSPPPTPSFPALSEAMAHYVIAAGRRARGESSPEPERGEDGDRDKPPKEPPEPGSLVLDAVRRRQKGR
jgi:hypothetical protein